MDILEKSLADIKASTQDAIDKQHNILAKAIYDVAEQSSGCSKTVDNIFAKVMDPKEFPASASPFNPHTVVDMTRTEVLEKWDKYIGVLPDRVVTDHYYVDFGYAQADKNICFCTVNTLHINQSGACCGKPACHINNMSSRDVRRLRGSTTHTPIYQVTSGTYGTTATFEVDNYLNLYHPTSSLYIMFNRTKFPLSAFQMVERINKSYGKGVFQSHWLNHNKLTTTMYTSLDQRPTFLQFVQQMVPPDYQHTLEVFNTFRELSKLSSSLCTSLQIGSDPDSKDPRDAIINELQLKLAEAISNTQQMDSLVVELNDDYRAKSDEVLSLKKEFILQDKAHKEEHEMKISSTDEHIESLKVQVFQLKTKLAEATSYQTKNEVLGITILSKSKDLNRIKSDCDGYRAKNTALAQQIVDERKKIKEQQEQYQDVIIQFKTITEENSQYQLTVKKMSRDIQKKESELTKQSGRLSALVSKSTDSLDSVLNDRILELEEQLTKANTKYCELRNQYDATIRDKGKVMSTLQGLLGY